MKILIVSQYFWPESFGINQLANDLVAEGVQVDVLTGMPNYPQGDFYKGYGGVCTISERWGKLNIFRLPIIRRGLNSRFRLAANYLSFLLSGFLLSPILLRGKKYDLIFVYGVSPILQSLVAAWLGKLKKIPVILWVQDLWPESVVETGYLKSKVLFKLLEVMTRLCYKTSDMILAQSEAFLDSIGRLAPNRKIYYFPNSIDKSFYQGGNATDRIIPSLAEGFSILFAGNIGSAQAVDVIVRSAEKLKDFVEIKFVIMGDGSKLRWLQSEIKRLGLTNVHYEGSFPIEEMPKILRQASALLVTLSNKEIFGLTIPNKIQAYLAVGRPIIGSLNGEGAKIIEQAGAGFSASAEDADDLVKVILKMYKLRRSKLNEMGDNGRKYFKLNFDSEMLTKKLIVHFETLGNRCE